MDLSRRLGEIKKIADAYGCDVEQDSGQHMITYGSEIVATLGPGGLRKLGAKGSFDEMFEEMENLL